MGNSHEGRTHFWRQMAGSKTLSDFAYKPRALRSPAPRNNVMLKGTGPSLRETWLKLAASWQRMEAAWPSSRSWRCEKSPLARPLHVGPLLNTGRGSGWGGLSTQPQSQTPARGLTKSPGEVCLSHWASSPLPHTGRSPVGSLWHSAQVEVL